MIFSTFHVPACKIGILPTMRRSYFLTMYFPEARSTAGMFLTDALEAHLAMVLWLNPEDHEDPVLTVGGHRVVVTGEALAGPALQRNDEEGKKPFVYQKTFDLGLSLELSALRS